MDENKSKICLNLLVEKILKTGSIHLVNLSPTVGDEITKSRPVVVINPGDEKNLRLAIVVPITQWKKIWEQNPFFVTIDSDTQSGLRKKSVVDCFQVRAISHSRFIDKIGEVSHEQLDQIKSALSLILDIDSEHCTY